MNYAHFNYYRFTVMLNNSFKTNVTYEEWLPLQGFVSWPKSVCAHRLDDEMLVAQMVNFESEVNLLVISV